MLAIRDAAASPSPEVKRLLKIARTIRSTEGAVRRNPSARQTTSFHGDYNHPMAPLMLVTAGRMGAGKSTVATRLSAELHLPILSFTQHVFGPILDTLRLARSRDSFQQLGRMLMQFPGEEALVDALLSHRGYHPAILDDVRYPTTLRILEARGYLPRVIYLHMPESFRQDRLKARDGTSAADQQLADAFPTEERISELERCADLRLDNSGDLEQTVTCALERINTWIPID